MADTIRGNGLSMVETALVALAEDPERLDRARMRFEDSPPSYTSRQSHNSTLSQSPDVPEQRRREEPPWQRILERTASLPYNQFGAQVREEKERIIEADINRTRLVPVGTDFYKLAAGNVRKSWVEQGIWNDNWSDMAQGRWKHEEPLELSSESDTDTETNSEREPKPNLFGHLFTGLSPKAELKPRRPTSGEEIRQAAERRAIREREREASRPFHQFVHQVSKERERIQDELGVGEAATSIPADINTRAYENVKNIWIKRGIWYTRWGTLPGMSWKHERPSEEVFDDDYTPAQANPPEDDSRGVERVTSIFERHPSAEYHQASDTVAAQQGIHPSIETPVSENGNVQHSPSTSNRLRPKERRRDVRSASRQGPGRGQAETSFGPVPSKVSKPPRAEQSGPRRGRNAPGEFSDNSPLLLGGEIHELGAEAARMPPRRSQRLQNRIEGLGEIVPTDLPKNPPRARQRRIGAGTVKFEGSAKPHGVSKRQRPRRRGSK